MSLVVTSADVELFAELSRRLGNASSGLTAAAARCASLLTAASWSGPAAAAGRDEEQRLARSLATLGRRFGDLAATAARTRDELSVEVARRRAFEVAVLNGLGRLARAPGDLEADTRSELARVRGMLPVSGHQLWEHLHHSISNLLP